MRTLILSLRDLESDLLLYRTSTEFMLTTPYSQLEQANAIEGFAKIAHRNKDAHADLNSILQSQ